MSYPAPPVRPEQPRRLLRALTGIVAAAAAVGVGHAIAALLAPAGSPLLVTGSTLIDLAPTPVKTTTVRLLGTADKPFLITVVGVGLVVVAALLGLLAWRHRMISIVGIALLGIAGIAATLRNQTIISAVPSAVAGLIGVVVLLILVMLGAGSADPTDSPTPAASGGSRRGFLIGLGAAGVLAAAGGLAGTAIGKVQSAAQLARDKIKLPTPTSPAEPLPAAAQIPGDTPFVTGNDHFYRVDISLTTPQVPVDGWQLRIDGMVDQPLTLGYDDLLTMPMIERDITLTSVSNEVGGPYVSTARWLGVPFTEIIRRVGVRAGVDQVYSYSSDSGYTCSTPFQAVSDGRDAMVVVGMNGEVLPAEHGFPARMLVPGLFGFVSATKWLNRMEFTSYRRRTAYWTRRGWATDAPILVQSRIDVPQSLGTISRSKPVPAGVAWAQHRGIAKVEVQVDDGPWQPASLATDAGVDLWRQCFLPYHGRPGRHTARVRATSLTGETQPERRTKVFPSGATGWHEIQFSVE